MAVMNKRQPKARRNNSRVSRKSTPGRAKRALAAGAPSSLPNPKADGADAPPAEDMRRAEDLAPFVERERTSYDGDTAIKLYLREIGQVKLQTADQEVELAAKIKKGDKKARE